MTQIHARATPTDLEEQLAEVLQHLLSNLIDADAKKELELAKKEIEMAIADFRKGHLENEERESS